MVSQASGDPDGMKAAVELRVAPRYQRLLSGGDGVNQTLGGALTGRNPLHNAAAAGSLKDVLAQLRRGFQVSSTSRLHADQGRQALHLAARGGHLDVAEALLKAQAGPDAADYEGFRPIHIAAQCGHAEMVELLFRAGATPAVHTHTGLRAVHLAAASGKVEVLKKLQKFHCDLTVTDHHQATPLHHAAREGSLEAVEWLLGAGVSPDIKDEKNMSAADWASMHEHYEVARTLDNSSKNRKRIQGSLTKSKWIQEQIPSLPYNKKKLQVGWKSSSHLWSGEAISNLHFTPPTPPSTLKRSNSESSIAMSNRQTTISFTRIPRRPKARLPPEPKSPPASPQLALPAITPAEAVSLPATPTQLSQTEMLASPLRQIVLSSSSPVSIPSSSHTGPPPPSPSSSDACSSHSSSFSLDFLPSPSASPVSSPSSPSFPPATSVSVDSSSSPASNPATVPLLPSSPSRTATATEIKTGSIRKKKGTTTAKQSISRIFIKAKKNSKLEDELRVKLAEHKEKIETLEKEKDHLLKTVAQLEEEKKAAGINMKQLHDSNAQLQKQLEETTDKMSEGIGLGRGEVDPCGPVRRHRRNKESAVLTLRVKAAASPYPDGPGVYPCYSNPRGAVYIINYKSFSTNPLMTRHGSEYDVINLENVFRQMGYRVDTRWDLTRQNTLDYFRQVSLSSQLQHVSSLFVFILSHGEGARSFLTHDLATVTLDEVQCFFLDLNCPQLRGKPKIFFSHFCRGSDEEIRCLIVPEAKREAYKDMLCLYSSTEGFRAYRHASLGTPSVRAFCLTLAQHACDKKLCDVIMEFQRRYDSMEGATSPEVQNFTFDRDFYFNPIGRRWIE